MSYFKNVGFVYRNASFVLWIKQRTIERTVVLKVYAIKKVEDPASQQNPLVCLFGICLGKCF
jgi:hypothetical protein